MIWSGHNKLSRGVWDTDRDLSALYLICAHRHRVITLALGPKIVNVMLLWAVQTRSAQQTA